MIDIERSVEKSHNNTAVVNGSAINLDSVPVLCLLLFGALILKQLIVS
jgi:hypothetical protein